MKTIEDHAIDIFKEYPNIPMQEMVLRLMIRIKIVPIAEQALQEIQPEIPNIDLTAKTDSIN